MAKARNLELRRDILSTLDDKAVCTFEDIEKHLNKLGRNCPTHTARYVVASMVKEGSLKIFDRGQHNRAFYVKGMFPNKTILVNPKGDAVGLQEFIATLDELVAHPLLNEMALVYLKHSMMNSIAISDRDSYAAKLISPPSKGKLKKRLEDFRKGVEQLHRFVKAFIDADIWSDVGQERMMKELKATGVISTIVDSYGKMPHESERNTDDE